MISFGIAPESKVYYLDPYDKVKPVRIIDLINIPFLSLYGDEQEYYYFKPNSCVILKKKNNTPLRLINWVNEDGELGGIRCTDYTLIYILRDNHLIFCKAKDIKVGDTIILRCELDVSMKGEITSNTVVPYIDEFVYFIDSIGKNVIVNDIVIKTGGDIS